MPLVEIDATNEQNFAGYRVMPKGVYLFEVTGEKGGQLSVGMSSTNKPMIKVELHCIDEANNGEYKGVTVWDNITMTPKSEFKLTHLALASGKYTKEQLKASRGPSGRALIDTSLLDHAVVRAAIDVEAPKTLPDGKQIKERNVVARYIFEQSEEEAAETGSVTTGCGS